MGSGLRRKFLEKSRGSENSETPQPLVPLLPPQKEAGKPQKAPKGLKPDPQALRSQKEALGRNPERPPMPTAGAGVPPMSAATAKAARVEGVGFRVSA